MKKLKRFKPKATYKSKSAFIWVAAFVVIGSITLIITKAAVPTANIQPELGSRTSSVTVGTDPNSSGGYVQFNAPSVSGGGMQFISRNLPVFGATNTGAINLIKDTDLSNGWESQSLPSWAAY